MEWSDRPSTWLHTAHPQRHRGDSLHQQSYATAVAAGMGDAMATHYEAQVCARNPQAYTWMHPLTHRPPLIAAAIGEVCLRTLYELVRGRGGGCCRVLCHSRIYRQGEGLRSDCHTAGEARAPHSGWALSAVYI